LPQIKRFQKSGQRKRLPGRPESEVVCLLRRAEELLSDAGIPEPLLESELILAHLLNTQRYNLYIDPPGITEKIRQDFFFLVSKRANRIPLAYLLKEVYFYNHKFHISKGVFIPRPETETIISCAMEFIKERNKKIDILDICTGCGVLAIVLARIFPEATVVATDISKKAVSLARKNICFHNLQSRVSAVRADLIPEGLYTEFTLIVSNPPYLTGDEIIQAEPEIRKEPFGSLYGGKDGMDIFYRILDITPKILSKDGFLIMEISPVQVRYFRELKNPNFSLVSVCKDICGNDRVVILKKTFN